MLERLFTPDVVRGLEERRNPSASLRARLNVINAERFATDPAVTRAFARFLAARRQAWDGYVTAMSQAGRLDPDVTARLVGVDDQNFRGAMAECMICALLGELDLGLAAAPGGAPGRVPDFTIALTDGNITLEVKSPYADPPVNPGTGVNYAATLLNQIVETANRQFHRDRMNVVAIVPLVEPPVLTDIRWYLNAFYGEERITFDIDPRTGTAVNAPQREFFTDGRFLRLWPEPRNTRIGAVLVLRELIHEHGDMDGDGTCEIELKWFVLHNPRALHPVPTTVWGTSPQCIRDGDAMRWNDGAPIYRR